MGAAERQAYSMRTRHRAVLSLQHRRSDPVLPALHPNVSSSASERPGLLLCAPPVVLSRLPLLGVSGRDSDASCDDGLAPTGMNWRGR
jgi:hypothetical protein